ncbi:MAG: hypothetical protein U0793_18960 [Gemmataceae bacterium]
MTRRLFAALALALLVVASADVPSADANPPFTVNFTFRFDVECPQDAMFQNLAPWYTYFPYDPRVAPRAPAFPSWPSTWPPTAPATPTPTPTPVSARGWQTVSYQQGVPYYWYQR